MRRAIVASLLPASEAMLLTARTASFLSPTIPTWWYWWPYAPA